MKKLVAALTLLLLCAGLLSGCGGNSNGENMNEKVELAWYLANDGKVQDLQMVQDAINKYLEGKTNCTLTIKSIPMGDYDAKMNTITASGEKCDIVFTCSWLNNYAMNAGKGYFTPMDDLLQEYGKDILKTIPPYLFTAATVKGKIYAIPSLKDLAYMQTYVVNKKFANQYGFSLNGLVGLSSLLPLFDKAHAADKTVAGLQGWPVTEPLGIYDTIISGNMPGAVRFDSKDCKVINQWEDKDWVDFIKLKRKMFLDKTLSGASNDFEKGKAVACVGVYAPEQDKSLSRQYARVAPDGVVSVPQFTPAVLTTGGCTGSMIAISSTSKYPAHAMQFLNLLLTDKTLANLVAYGIENVHYKKDGENHIVFTERHNSYDMPSFIMGLNKFITYAEGEQPGDIWQQFEKYNNSATKSPILGFVFDSEAVKNELSAIKNASDEFALPIANGSLDPDTALPKYIAKIKAFGWDKVQAEMQRQVDEWRKTQK